LSPRQKLTVPASRDSNESVPTGEFDHVFVIMMVDHGFSQIVGNPNVPFLNEYIKKVNIGTSYTVAHPRLTNYLEVTGGSNFGALNDILRIGTRQLRA
jgi:hypothetical protein